MLPEYQDVSPVNRPVREAASYYSSLAPWYDLLAGSEKKYIRAGLELLDPQPQERILEIGSGTGYAQIRIAEDLAGGYSIGLDLAIEMARISREKLLHKNRLSQVGFVISDSLPLPFTKSSIDGIFSSFTLELFDTPLLPRVLGECRRVLKTGGKLVVVSLSKDQPLPWMGRLYETLHNRWPRLLDCRPIPVTSLLNTSGFTIIDTQKHRMWGIPVSIISAVVLSKE